MSRPRRPNAAPRCWASIFPRRWSSRRGSLHPGIDFREGDAEQLPLGNGLFDAAAMNFGILHLGHPEKALGRSASSAARRRTLRILRLV